MTNNSIRKEYLSTGLKKHDGQLTDIENERIKSWRQRHEQAASSYLYKQIDIGDKGVELIANLSNRKLTDEQQQELALATLFAATGSSCHEYANMLLNEVVNGFFDSKSTKRIHPINAIHGALLALNPRDEIEGMLCSRLLVLHNQYMKFLYRATISDQTSQGIDININRAIKLMRVYNETLETLNRHRRKGEQKVTVQHVNINDGGQAVVNGQINRGGGNNDKT